MLSLDITYFETVYCNPTDPFITSTLLYSSEKGSIDAETYTKTRSFTCSEPGEYTGDYADIAYPQDRFKCSFLR